MEEVLAGGWRTASEDFTTFSHLLSTSLSLSIHQRDGYALKT